MDATSATVGERNLENEKWLTGLIYGLYAASLVVGVTALIAIVLNHVKQKDVAGTWLEGHFRWQIRTFWFTLLWTIVGVFTVVFLVGWAILAVAGLWFIYRVVRGFIRLGEERSPYEA